MSAVQPKSVVFETPPPTYVFHNTFFQATVKLADAHKHKVTGYERALQVTLRYHDTYDVVSDQSLLVVDDTALAVSAASGTCQLNVMLKKLTAACDGRAFCLEIRACDGDLESAFSSPIHVVKEKLHVFQQPPDVWFKDEGGREKCMVVVLVVEAAPNARIEERVVPLQLKLLYESGTPVLNQNILRLFPDMRPNMSRGRVSISFRIDDVSKNHQGQSFVLEISPEKQATSHMFQDIAPARTAVIAIRSKRNKRKLNGLTPRGNGVATTPLATGSNGTVASTAMSQAGNLATPANGMMNVNMPMNVNGNGGNNGMHMMVAPSASPTGPPPSQRPRHLGAMMMPMNTPGSSTHTHHHNNQYVLTPHPRMGPGMMMMPPAPAQNQTPTHQTPTPASQSWSTHIQHQQQQHQQQLQLQQQQQQHMVATPTATAVSTPMANAPTAGMTVEWKLAGFEIHPDGSPNVSRPIYRCTHCRRLVDVEMMSHGQDLHATACVFVPSNHHHHRVMATTPQHHHPQQQHPHTPQNQGYYNVTPRAVYPTSNRAATPRAVAAQSSTPMSHPNPEPSPFIPEMAIATEPLVPATDSTGTSPKALANMVMHSGQRPVLTISPFMNKIVTSDSMVDSSMCSSSTTQSTQSSSSSSSSSSDDPRGDGNLFASNAFRSQMDLSDMQAPSPTTEEKLLFLSKPLEVQQVATHNHATNSYSLMDPTTSTSGSPQHGSDSGESLIVSVGGSSSASSLYNEMTSMGISVDGCFSKSTDTPTSSGMLDPGHPMADFSDLSSGLTDEDQVFYILARMYSTPQAGKLGLPAFDQFQRMLGFYSESQDEVQTQVVFSSILEVGLSGDEQLEITSRFQDELAQGSDAVHSLPKYQHNLVLLREDALMFYWSQSLQCLT